MRGRFYEIDALRGIAVVMMIIFHFLFDLDFFGVSSFNLEKGFWLVFARITAVIFIFLVGLSLTISYSKAERLGKASFKKYLKRGLKIFGFGLIISLITFILFPKWVIIFGILHFIGLSIILAYPIVKQKGNKNWLNLLLGIAVIVAGVFLSRLSFDFSYLLWLGLMPSELYTFDYFPLLPWFGVVLLGIFLGNLLYKDKRLFKIPRLKSRAIPFFCFLGRHSLFIYLLHQPVLSGLILLLKFF